MKRFFLLILLFSTLTSSAQKTLTIEEAIATALQNNYAIQLSKNDSAVAALDYSFFTYKAGFICRHQCAISRTAV